MSVTTTADERYLQAKEYVKKAKNLLLEAVHDDTWGSESYDKAAVYDLVIKLEKLFL